MSKALLVISVGTSHRESRRAAFESIEQDLCAAFPERRFYRAWTSAFLRNRLRETEGLSVDAPAQAVERMLADGVTDLLVQPAHLMHGGDYAALRGLLASHRLRFSALALGAPLLAERADVLALAGVLERVFAEVSEDELLALIGHGGALADPNPYEGLNEAFRLDGFSHFCVGTLAGAPGLVPVLSAAWERRPARILLAPLMVAAGVHTLRDVAGPAEHSCRSMLERQGFTTVSLPKGLGEYGPVRALYVSHARRAEGLGGSIR